MIKNELVSVFLYDDKMSFEELSNLEAQIIECFEEKLYEIEATFLTTESLASSLHIRCELPELVPLHFLRNIMDTITVTFPNIMQAKVLLFSSSLENISVGIFECGEYSIRNMSSMQILQHKERPILKEQEILKKQLFS